MKERNVWKEWKGREGGIVAETKLHVKLTLCFLWRLGMRQDYRNLGGWAIVYTGFHGNGPSPPTVAGNFCPTRDRSRPL